MILPNFPRATAAGLFLCLTITQNIYGAVGDQLSAEQWLKKMQEAAVFENYRGVFVFSRGKMESSMRVVHRYHNNEEQQRLTQLDGAMGEIIRRGNEVICVFPDNRVVQVEQSLLTNKIAQAFSNFVPNHGNYRLSLVGKSDQVDRPSVKMSVQAKDTYRYSYMLWLDQKTGLLLKSVLSGKEGGELERFQYTQIEFPSFITDQELQVSNGSALVKHEVIPVAKKDRTWPVQTMWMVEWTPPGFEPVSGPVGPGDNVMVYSDGLASYSVFIEKSAEKEMLPEGASLVGATVAYAQKLQFEDHLYNVTVVGEVPPMTAMMVAESVKPKMQ